jgi:Flp pilus assembly CpaF family ATPase
MFIIVNDEKIHRFNETQVTVGRSRSCDLTLDGLKVALRHCRLTRDQSGVWWVTRLDREPLLLNRNLILSNRPARVGASDELSIGEFTIQIRDSDRGAVVARALRMKLFSLQAELHQAVLDTIRNNTAGLTDQMYRQRIEAELDRQLKVLQLGTELEVHLAAQALRSIISDQVQGFAHRQSVRMRENGTRSYVERCAPLIPQLLKLIKFDPSETAPQRAERVAVLLPWALNSRKGVIQPWDRRELAVGLIREQLIDIIFGLGPLEDLMVAPDINDVMVLPSGHIFIERDGHMQDSGRKMLSAEVSRRIIERIVASEGRRIDQSSPMVNARIADGSRLNAIIEPVAVSGPTLTIRRFSSKRLSMENLIEKGSLTETAATFLRACVLARKNIVLAGGTGSGKTTLLNALSAYIPASERIVTVEDTAEIQLSQTHVVTLQAKPANLEGRNEVSIRDLVRNTLRMRPDRIIVGECRGGEALDMLQAMNTGHDGSLTTIHANSPPDAVRRLEVMSMEAEKVNLPSRALREQIASAVHVLIQISRLPRGARRVTSVCEVVGIDDEDGTIIIEEIFRLRRHKKKGALSQTKLAFTGYVPSFIDELIQTNVVTIEGLF